MAQALSLERVYEALAALNGPDPLQSESASKWLEQFQKTVDAWTASDQILNEGRSFEACLFAAQTIRNKVLYNMHELPVDSYAALRDSLLAQLINIETKLGRNVSSILLQLCAALSDLYIQVVEWRGFVPHLVSQLSEQKCEKSRQILINFFKILPEELYNRRLKIGENRRKEVEQELAAETAKVLNILAELCAASSDPTNSSAGNGTLTKAVNCLASWLLNKQCPTETLAHSPLLHSIICCLAQENVAPDLHDAATECLGNALQLIDDTNPYASHQNELARVLQQGIFRTADAFRLAVRDEDSDRLQNFTRLYAENCEAFLTEIVKHPGNGFGDLRALEMLQLVNDYHEYNLVEMGFHVWYRLSEYLYQCDEVDFDDLREAFKPFVEKHVLSLCRHCRVDSDSLDVLSGRSELAEFRQKAQESVRDVTFIIGSVDLLRLLMEVLKSTNSWDQMEAILFIISAFIHNIVETENLVVPTLLESILKLPMAGTHKQLLKTSAQLLGNLQDWLVAQHTFPNTDTDFMIRAFNWFCELFVFSGAGMALTVSECLEQLVERGWEAMQKRSLHERYLQNMFEMIASIEKSETKAQEMEQAAQHLLKASTYLINDLPSAQLCACLEQLSAKPIEKLEQINSLTNVPPDPQPSVATTTSPSTSSANKENVSDAWETLATDPILWLDRLSCIWRTLKPWQSQLDFKQIIDAQSNQQPGGRPPQSSECPWLPLCTKTVQCALTTLQQQQRKQRVIEHCCRTIRFLIRSMGAQSIVFIEPVANQIILVYAQFPHSCLLYLASILIDEYGSMEYVLPGMQAMLENLATRSLLLLSSTQDGFQMNPDTVDDLYRLAVRFMQRAPSAILSHPINEQLVQGAIHGLSVNHQDANRSLSKFLMEVIEVASGKRGSSIAESDVQRVKQFLSVVGQQLMLSAVSATIFHLSSSLVKEVAEIVFALISLDKNKAGQWLDYTCMQIPHDGGNSATPEQLLHFRTRVASAERPYDVVLALRDVRKFYA